MHLLQVDNRVVLYLPESFEWLILNSGVIIDAELEAILEHPENYVDSMQYFSWEQFFTHILIEKTEHSYLKYSKRSLNPTYLHENIKTKILNSMEIIVEE